MLNGRDARDSLQFSCSFAYNAIQQSRLKQDNYCTEVDETLSDGSKCMYCVRLITKEFCLSMIIIICTTTNNSFNKKKQIKVSIYVNETKQSSI